MDRTTRRSDYAGLAVALAGHVGLVALLSLHLMKPPPLPSTEHPITISLVEDVGLQQAAPPATEAPSAAEAPEQGAPEEAAAPAQPAPQPKAAHPPPKAEPNPEPATARPEPKPEPKPVPKPKAEPKPQPKPEPKPAPKPKPQPKPEPAKPAPAKPAPAKPASAVKPAPAAARVTPTRAGEASAKPLPDRLAGVVSDAVRADAARSAAAGRGSSAAATAPRARGSRLGDDFLKGLANTPSKAPPSHAAPGKAISARALADIGSAIQRQVQPCADQQPKLGPGAERIRVAINLKLNRNGSLAAPPRVVNHDGVDGENRRYLDRVDDLAIATFTACSPLKGLPADLYDVPNGWSSFTLRFTLRG